MTAKMNTFVIFFGFVATCVLFFIFCFFSDIRRWYAIKFGKVKVWFEIEEFVLKETRNIEGKTLERKVGYLIVKCSNIKNRRYLSFSSLEFRPYLVVEIDFRYKASVFPTKDEAERIIAEIYTNPDNFIMA